MAGAAMMTEYEMNLLPKVHRDKYDAVDEEAAALVGEGQPPISAEAANSATVPVPGLMDSPYFPPAAEEAVGEGQPPISAEAANSATVPVPNAFETRLAALEAAATADREAIALLRAENDRLTAEAAARSAIPALPAGPITDDALNTIGLTQSQRDFGDEMWDGVHKIAASVAAGAVAALEARIAAIEANFVKKVEAITQESEHRRALEFVTERAKRIPDWETLKASPKFTEWLNGRDAMRGTTRFELAQGALDRSDIEALEAVCNTYRPKPAPVAPRPSVASQVMPSPTGGAPTPVAAEKPTYSVAEFKRLSNEAARLTTSDPKRARELSDALDAAVGEGRVRG